MAFRSPKVIIIGGGIAGPVLALALKQRNISSIVFELRPHSIRREGGYFALAPNALRVLRSIGVYDEIRSQGYNYEGLDFLSSRNLAVLGRVQNGSLKHYGFEALRVSRHLVRQALLVELLRQGIEIRYDSKCIQITEDDIYLQEEEEEEEAGRYGGVTVEFANGHVERGDFVVGADGIHSSVRKYIDPAGESEPQFTRLMGVGGTVHRSRLSALRPDMSLPCLILGKDNSFAMMPATNDGSEIGFFATIEEEERSRDTWAELGSDKEYLSKVLKERHSADNTSWPEVVRQVCLEMPSESLTVWPYVVLSLLSPFLFSRKPTSFPAC
jgi:2-polyprenyl-6-methoxyphenol hydroxylase-like FAD-dependent oxidoreductase